MASTLKLLTNIPVIGEIKYCNFYLQKPSKIDPTKLMSEQWGLKGTFWVQDGSDSGPVEASVYLDTYQVPTSPVQLGLAQPKGERDGVPQFQWIFPGKIQIVKREEGRKKFIVISRVGESIAVPQIAMPTVGNQTLTPYPAPQVQAYQAITTTVPVISVNYAPGTVPTDEWAALEARYAKCVEIADRCWREHQMDQPALVAAAATLFIASDKAHMTAPASAPTTLPLPAGAIGQQLDAGAHATDAQIAAMRVLLNNPVFSSQEKQDALQAIYGATVASMNGLIEILQSRIKVRGAAPAGAGPGHPSSFAEVPTALEHDDDLENPLPF